jgi:metal-responsive CopG/Arc/MetJ family transcriptional regulator
MSDDLYRDIERARKRAGKDRSLWLQEAASEYLKKRTKEEEIEAWLSAYERVPLSADEKALSAWLGKTLPERFAAAYGDEKPVKTRRRRGRSQ